MNGFELAKGSLKNSKLKDIYQIRIDPPPPKVIETLFYKRINSNKKCIKTDQLTLILLTWCSISTPCCCI